MWAIGLELVVPALLLLVLWRVWPKAPDDAPSREDDAHDDSPR